MHTTPRHVALRTVLVAAMLATVHAPPSAAAESEVELEAKHARQGAGLRVGAWDVRNLTGPAGGETSESLAFEGYFEKGLDLHLSWENTLGFWRRTQASTEAGTFGETRRELNSYIVPTMTALKVHPFTRPSDVLEPHASAGLGFVFGIDRENVSGTDPLVVPGESTRFVTGFGLEAGAGLDWRPGSAFGLSAGGRYRWMTFGEDVGGARKYEGFAFDLGVTYRFQYR